MAKWEKPELETLDITETAHNWRGNRRDGGYVGDGMISGHLGWDEKKDELEQNPADALS